MPTYLFGVAAYWRSPKHNLPNATLWLFLPASSCGHPTASIAGASLDRPGLNRLLSLTRRGSVDQILVHRLDRLSRSVRHCVALLDELRRLEVGLVVVTAPELGHSAQDHFMLNIMASFAEFERELIAARIADSRARLKARHLRFAGGVPFGYDSDRLTKQLVPNEEEAEIIR